MKIHIFNARVSLISDVRFLGKDRMKEILGLTDIPEIVKPLLRQSVLPDKFLAELEAIKGQVRAMLVNMATSSTFFGWIIDPNQKDELLKTMEELKVKFYQKKAEAIQSAPEAFKRHTDAMRQKCIDGGLIACDAYIEAIKAAQPSLVYLESSLQFGYLKPKTIELFDDEVEVVRQGVYGQALHEISMRAKTAAEAEYVTTKLRAADDIIAKLNGLSYVEPQFRQISQEMMSVMAQIPRGISNTKYDTLHVLAVNGMLQMLANDERVIQSLAMSQPLFNQTMLVTPQLELQTPDAIPVIEQVLTPATVISLPVINPVEPVVIPVSMTHPVVVKTATAAAFSAW